jgi:brefeldin A-inhibited guanine nucleotide-exchange protein
MRTRTRTQAIVVFVRALCTISLDELRDAKAPRVFTLTKVVEVALYNMTRIRYVCACACVCVHCPQT